MSDAEDRRRTTACCRALLSLAGLTSFWTPEGPAGDAQAILDGTAAGRFYSASEKALVRVCFDLWNGKGRASIAELIASLNGAQLEAVGELLVAIANGPPAADAWRARYEET